MRIWNQVKSLAEQTPEHRNRYIDFLRAASIMIVIIGHWLIATVYYVDGSFTSGHLFAIQPATRWLTWFFQVMPVFFIVGGYSNAASLDSAQRKGLDYASWLSVRLRRLLTPLLLLLVVWAAIAAIMHGFAVKPTLIQWTSKAALIPIWFLAIYIMVVILAPVMYRIWQRLGLLSIWILVAIAILSDIVLFNTNVHWFAWSSYFWVWLAVHNLGFAWHDGIKGSSWQYLLMSLLALTILFVLVFVGPYPLAMVGYPGQELSNTTPPKITLLALATFQFGLLLALEQPMRKSLNNLRLWTTTVLINSMIMSIYLWHVTVMVILISLLYLVGGFGLGIAPGSSEWWISRLIWVGILFALLLPVALLVSPLERVSRGSGSRFPSALRQVGGAMMICLGVALLARFGFATDAIPFYGVPSFGLVVVGAFVSGVFGFGSSSERG